MNSTTFNGIGIPKRWRSKKAVAKRLACDSEELIRIQSDINAIELYNRRGDVDNKTNLPCKTLYFRLASILKSHSVSTALTGGNWLAQINKSTAYSVMYFKLHFFWNYQFVVKGILNNENPPEKLGIFFYDEVEYMGWLFLLGQIEEAKVVARLIYAAIHRNYCRDFNDEYHRRGQMFMLRLFGKWQDITIDFPNSAYDEPVYEWLLAHWDIADEQALLPALLAASDRHTHQSWDDTNKANHDFHHITLYRCPLELLMLFRLRALTGLKNPVVEHPLFDAPFDQLPEPQPVYIDDMMQATLKRVREDWPHYDKVLDDAITSPFTDADYEFGKQYEQPSMTR